jgi:hypothetical protein
MRWAQDHDYGPGGSKKWGADGVREFMADPNGGGEGKWESQGGAGEADPWLRQSQAYLDTKKGPRKITRWQDVVRDAGGENGFSFSNAETLPGDEESGTMPQSAAAGLPGAGGLQSLISSDPEFFKRLMAQAQGALSGPTSIDDSALRDLLA